MTYETHQQNTGTKEIDVRRRITTFFILLAVTSTSLGEAKAEVKTFPCTGGTYSVEMPAATITKSNGCTGKLTIDPSVKSIGVDAFRESKITSILIPNSVTSIGDTAFYLSSLTSVVIPNSVATLGYSVFSDTQIESVVISSALSRLEGGVFALTKKLTSVKIPAGITSIGAGAFYGSGLTSIVIPSTVKTIDQFAFSESKLTQVDISDSTQFYTNTFSESLELKSFIYCGIVLVSQVLRVEITPTCPPDRKAKFDAAVKAAADKAAADKAAAEKAAAEKAAAEKAAADKAAADRAAVQAAQDAKKLTITCQKGKVKKQITGESPKCPSGYKNPLDAFLTFKAFSSCKLYKKDLFFGGVALEDEGKTLTFSAVGKYSYSSSAPTYSDIECALGVLKTPSFVKTQINTTRALDGMQKATWGKISALWTYHPDNGVNISFNSK